MLNARPVVHDDQRSQQHQHQDKGWNLQAPMPSENPQGVCDARYKKPYADALHRGFIFFFIAQAGNLIADKKNEKKINRPPDGKCQPRGNEQVRYGIGYLPGVPPVQRKSVGQCVDDEHGHQSHGVAYDQKRAIAFSVHNSLSI